MLYNLDLVEIFIPNRLEVIKVLQRVKCQEVLDNCQRLPEL